MSYRNSPILSALLLLSLTALNNPVRADALCFSLAENYYEQIYCELQALGKARDLPGWRDFRNNDEVTQALLLKRPARRAGIAVAMPLRRATSTRPPHHADQAAKLVPSPPSRPTAPGLSHCTQQEQRITCGQTQFDFVANRRNPQLRANALSAANRMELPEFNADHSDQPALAAYLQGAYVRYLDKMMDIGLAETTLTFDRFQFIFSDLAARGVSFRKRFETMYTYLKKDKASLAVPVSKRAPVVSLDACQQLSTSLIGCHTGRGQILFARSRKRSATVGEFDSSQ